MENIQDIKNQRFATKKFCNVTKSKPKIIVSKIEITGIDIVKKRDISFLGVK